MSGRGDTIRRALEEWLAVSADEEGFTYCCETALEHGLTYASLRELLALAAERDTALRALREARAYMEREAGFAKDSRLMHEAIRRADYALDKIASASGEPRE